MSEDANPPTASKRSEVNQKAKRRMLETPGALIQAADDGSKRNNTMTSINNFETNVYSEELANITESEYDEVMSLMAEDDSAFEGYSEWSASLDSQVVNESENFIATADGRVHHKPQPKSNGRIGGIEI